MFDFGHKNFGHKNLLLEPLSMGFQPAGRTGRAAGVGDIDQHPQRGRNAEQESDHHESEISPVHHLHTVNSLPSITLGMSNFCMVTGSTYAQSESPKQKLVSKYSVCA